MSVPPEQAEVAAWLGRLAGAAPVETHISLVFLGADTAWKLKKAVRLGFLDFTALADRHRFARRELELNAPAAPGLYRDVVAVVRRADGTLGFSDEATAGPAVLDWVLRMARVPEGDFLDRIVAAGRFDAALADAVADAVSAYHARCPPAAAGGDPAAALTQVMRGNAAAARAAGLPAADVAAWEQAMAAALARLGPWLAARARAGFLRRAHGDLHLGNLCLWQGRPVPFDALEFNEAMATIDLGYDLAFLLMDLDQHAGRAWANRVMNRYVARTGDTGLTRGLPAFLSQRAMVRAHVEAARGHRAAADAYLAASLASLRPAPALVVAIGGLPGTGKSTLARALAPALGRAPGALVLRSDEIRKRLHGVAPEERLPPAAYAPAVSARVFAVLAAAAGEAAAGGQAVIGDATFLDPGHRAAIAAASGAAGVRFLGLWLEAPLAALETRVAGRTADASDATVAVLRAAAASGHAAPAGWVRIDATDAPAALAAAQTAVAGTGAVEAADAARGAGS
jgi:aminoglycoside phosphotransferase family enzyme